MVFLEHVVSELDIKPDLSKINTVASWPMTRNVHDIHAFAGFYSYYGHYVRGYSTIASPLTPLLKTDVMFE